MKLKAGDVYLFSNDCSEEWNGLVEVYMHWDILMARHTVTGYLGRYEMKKDTEIYCYPASDFTEDNFTLKKLPVGPGEITIEYLNENYPILQ